MTEAARPDFFVLRSPLLPYDGLAAASATLAAPAALDDPERLDAALAADRARLRTYLAEAVARPEIRDALYLASPDLDHGLASWQADPDGERGQRVERTLVRYLERMAARATPFGLFAGCAVGTIGPTTALRLPARAAYRRHTRLDMQYLCGLVDALERDPAIRAQLRYRPNSSLYRLGDRWHWTRLTPDDEAHSHQYHRHDADPFVDAVVEAAGRGAMLADLAAAGHSAWNGELSTGGLDDADALLHTLVEQQLLVSDLQPAITGPEPIHALIARLEQLAPHAPLAASAAEALRQVRDSLDGIDAAGLGTDPTRYRDLAARLEALPAKVERSRLFQAELIVTPPTADGAGRLTLGPDVLAEIKRGVSLLRRLHRPQRDSLARFREAFVERYESREARDAVPLVEVLDPEVGLGFGPSTGHDAGEPLVDGLSTPPTADERVVRWGGRQTFLLTRLVEAIGRGAHEIALSGEDVERLAGEDLLPLPDAYSVSAVLAATSEEALAGGDFRVLLRGVAGPSGARLLGRFAHGDPVLRDHVAEHLRAEATLRPDVIFAEIAHLPEPRTGNVMHRPVFRDYEIVYLGVSGAPIDRQIAISDLLVSVEDERIVLRSARLGREVIPRLTSAQNYFHPRTTVLYRFLAALQDQGIAAGLGWDWGPLASAPFLPRVTFGRLVLARAQWRLTVDEISDLAARRGADLFRAVQNWRAGRQIPRRVRVADGDNELLVDFDNVLSVESFGQLLKGRDATILVEAFPGPDERCVRGPEGAFFHELSIPYVGASGEAPEARGAGRGMAIDERAASRVLFPGASPSLAAPGTARPAVGPAFLVPRHRPLAARSFSPGSEWLYARLYVGPSMADRLLREVVRPLVDDATGSGAADGWFFIRYADPDWQLRLRFHGARARLHAELLPALHDAVAPLLGDGSLRRFQLDTYDRELERYGGPVGMALSERVFEADSVAALEIVEAFPDHALATARWKLAVLGLSLLLDDLGLSLEQKLAVVVRLRDGFAREHRADQKLLRQIGDRFRAERGTLESLLDPASATAGPLAAGAEALRRRSGRLAPVIAELRRADAEHRLARPLTDLAASYLHLHANRMLRNEHRRQELLLYDMLCRLYESRAARARARAS